MLKAQAICFTLSILGIGDIEAACSSMTRDLHIPCIKSTMIADDNTDWLHRNDIYRRDVRTLEELQMIPTSLGLHEQHSFIARSTHEEKKRQRDSSEKTRQLKRERYSLMTHEQKDIRLQKNHDYKKCIRENRTVSDHEGIIAASAGTPIVQAQPYKYHHTGTLPMYIIH